MVQVIYEKENSRSAAYDGSVRIGMCQFEDINGIRIIYHTEVLPSYEGQGIAGKLVHCVSDEAENEGFAIKSTCSYAKKVLGR